MVHFKCDVHNWMNAYAGVLDHPYFAVTANGGAFELKDLPAGTYTIEAWHEKLGTQTQSVTLAAKETKTISFTFKADNPVIWLHRYIKLVVASTVLLIAAGGMVTSTDSGLAVPDWPNTYGQFMFSFPLEKMVGGIFYEHGHRMIASTVGFLTIMLAVWTWKAEPRRWMRWLGVTALGAVILQGLLGGITVLLLLPAPVSIGHAGLAQLFFCLTITLALFTSPWMDERRSRAVDDPTLRRVALATTVHGLLPDSPRRDDAAYRGGPGDSRLPATRSDVSCRRSGMPASPSTSRTASARSSSRSRSWQRRGTSGVITARAASCVRPATLLVLFVLAQVTLGAFVIWSGLQPIINTAHVVNGALVLATSLVLTLRSRSACRFASVTQAGSASTARAAASSRNC